MRTDTVYANPYPQEVRAAIYCRLSKDDDLSGPSASIQNQRELLCRYCEEQGWRVAGIFQDDGYTGLNMERPDFQKMLAAVERKMFDVVLTKDDCVIKARTPQTLENRHFLRIGTEFRAIQRPQRAAYHIETS